MLNKLINKKFSKENFSYLRPQPPKWGFDSGIITSPRQGILGAFDLLHQLIHCIHLDGNGQNHTH